MTIDFCTADDLQMIGVGRQIYTAVRQNHTVMQSAAQALAESVYSTLLCTDGKPVFAMFRIFYIAHKQYLPTHLQSVATNSDTDYWLVLAGTFGMESDWCDVLKSKHHQLIPATYTASPLLKAAFAQISRLKQFAAPEDRHSVELDGFMDSRMYFYVPDAATSELLTDQAEFVEAYNIRSVVGFGDSWTNGHGVLIAGFSHHALDMGDIARLSAISPYIMALISSFSPQDNLWQPT